MTNNKKPEVEYSALFSVGASTWVNFTLPAGSSYQEILEAAENAVYVPSICHQCSNTIDLGDMDELCEIINQTTGEIVRPGLDKIEAGMLWSYSTEKKSFIKVSVDRIDFGYKHTSLGKEKVHKTKDRDSKWTYQAVGKTKAEVAERYNSGLAARLANAEEAVRKIKEQLIKP